MQKIEFTERAKHFSAKYTQPVVEDQIRLEIADLLETGLSDPMELIFHTVCMDGDWDGPNTFICFPRNGVMVVDTANYEEHDKLESGPFKGLKVMIPSPDSEESE